MNETKPTRTTGIIDIHAHVLPGIDDGAKDWETSLRMLRMAWDAGVRCVIATPHHLPYAPSASAAQVRQLCHEAEQKAQQEIGSPFPILPGMELYYHSGTVEELESGEALSLAGGRYALVEFEPDAPWSQLLEAAEKMRRSNFGMVLAHCERYACLREGRRFHELQEKGVLFQSNLQVMNRGLFDGDRLWLRKRYAAQDIHFLASDMHNLSTRKPFTKEALLWYKKHLGDSYRKDLTAQNAKAYILSDPF